MAIYHLSVKIIGRNAGRSSVAAAAYRSGDTLTNEYDGLTHDYSRKHWIEHTEIMLPPNAQNLLKTVLRSGMRLNLLKNLPMLNLPERLKLLSQENSH